MKKVLIPASVAKLSKIISSNSEESLQKALQPIYKKFKQEMSRQGFVAKEPFFNTDITHGNGKAFSFRISDLTNFENFMPYVKDVLKNEDNCEEFFDGISDFEVQMNENYNKVASFTLEIDNLDSEITDKKRKLFNKAKEEAEDQLISFFEDIAKEYSNKCYKVAKSMME